MGQPCTLPLPRRNWIVVGLAPRFGQIMRLELALICLPPILPVAYALRLDEFRKRCSPGRPGVEGIES